MSTGDENKVWMVTKDLLAVAERERDAAEAEVIRLREDCADMVLSRDQWMHRAQVYELATTRCTYRCLLPKCHDGEHVTEPAGHPPGRGRP